MNWTSPNTSLPPLAKRVIVETEEGSILFARRVTRPDNIQQYRWIDDQSLPIRSEVKVWKEVVSSGETPA